MMNFFYILLFVGLQACVSPNQDSKDTKTSSSTTTPAVAPVRTPALFYVVNTDSFRYGTAGELLFTPFIFRVVDEHNLPVSGAHINYGTQESGPSDADGITSLQILLGTEERDYVLHPDSNSPYVFSIQVDGVMVHQVYVGHNVFDAGWPLYVFAAVGDSIETEPDPSAAAFTFAVLDKYGNRLHPSQYDLTSDLPVAYQNSSCTQQSSITINYVADYQEFGAVDAVNFYDYLAMTGFQATGTGNAYVKMTLDTSEVPNGVSPPKTKRISVCVGPVAF